MNYRSRRFVARGVTSIGPIQLKTYTITAEGRAAPDVIAGVEFARVQLPSATAQGFEETGKGYLIFHAGEVEDWLLVRWWINGGIVAGLLASRQGDARFEYCAQPYIECVWEGFITEFERSAWVRHMMTASPDTAAYLDDQLPTGLY